MIRYACGMATTVREALADVGSSLTEADVAELIYQTHARMHGSAPMPAGDVDYLLRRAGLSDASKQLLLDDDAEQMKALRENVATASRFYALGISMSVKDAAEALRKSPSTVYRSYERFAGFSVQGRRRIPSWAIHDGRELPRLSEIPTFIWRELHPLTVADIMTSPHESLEEKTPADWLATGGDIAPVVNLLEGHLRW